MIMILHLLMDVPRMGCGSRPVRTSLLRQSCSMSSTSTCTTWVLQAYNYIVHQYTEQNGIFYRIA